MNSIDFNKEATQLTSVACDTVVSSDVSEEFVLPDYVPEVRRVLFTRAQALPESKYISGDTVDFGGTVTYLVIYTDDEGRLCSVPLSSTYEGSCSVKGANDIFIDTAVDNATTRVSAPRRISIKSRLKSRVLGLDKMSLGGEIRSKSSADEMFIERLQADFKTASVCYGELNGVKISEKLDTGSRKELRAILCDATCNLKNVSATSGGVSVRGEACVRVVCESEGEIFTLSRSVPIQESVEVSGALEGDGACARARCVSLSISSEENDTGCELFFDLCYDIEAEVYRSTTSTLTLDCYSTKVGIDCEYEDISLYSLASCGNDFVTISESVKRKNKDICEIIDVLCDPVCEKYEIKGNTLCLSARLCTYIIGKGKTNDDGTFEYISESYELPIKHEWTLPSPCQGATVRVGVSASALSARLSDDKIHLGGEVYPSFCVLDKSQVRVLSEATLNHGIEHKKDASCVRAYFPKGDESLWDIAKRYHTTREKLMRDNSLSSESLEGVKALII